MAYRFEGKQKLFSIGVYPAVSLSDARQRRDEARRLLAQGIDPNAKKQAEVKELKAKRDKTRTFAVVAKAWFSTKKNGQKIMVAPYGSALKHMSSRQLAIKMLPNWIRGICWLQSKRLKRLVILKLPCAFNNTLRRSFVMLFSRNSYAITLPYDMEDAVQKPQTEHRPALELEEIPQLLKKIAEYKGRRLTILAIQLNLMIFIRSSELRFARWSEIDFKSKLWVIPEQREAIENVKHSTRGAKMKCKHFVPLCNQTMKILKEIRQLTYEEGHDDGLIFTGCYDSFKPMSENTINKALRNMGYDTKQDICGHGFLTLACNALIESGLWSGDAVGLQMSHKESNSVRAAYTHKAKHLDQHRLMLRWWADYLDANSNGMVRPFEFAQRR